MDADDDYRRAVDAEAAGDPAGAEALRRLAGRGHPPACFRLAMAGIADDAAVPVAEGALALLRRAAEAGHARACFQLGLLHAQGRAGGPVDLVAARQWCAQAAARGLAVAQFNLGLLAAQEDGGDPGDALRWLRLAAVNEVAEADACLELLAPADGHPRSWEEAETRASVALARSDPAAPKTVRFAEYYVDPCLDLLSRRLALRREEISDIVQQFFLELEEPLSKGAHRGRPWKEALRGGYDRGRGRFRPFLGRALVNFARDWLRGQRRNRRPPAPSRTGPDLEALRPQWQAVLERFRTHAAGLPPRPARAVGILVARLADDLEHRVQAERLGLDQRTVRRDVLLAGELLREWLAEQVADLPETAPGRTALANGLSLVPEWLLWLSADKRARLLSYLVLLERARDPQIGM